MSSVYRQIWWWSCSVSLCICIVIVYFHYNVILQFELSDLVAEFVSSYAAINWKVFFTLMGLKRSKLTLVRRVFQNCFLMQHEEALITELFRFLRPCSARVRGFCLFRLHCFAFELCCYLRNLKMNLKLQPDKKPFLMIMALQIVVGARK